MATWLNDYKNRKLSLEPLLQRGKMSVQELLVYQELLYRIQILETCQSLCKTAPVSTDMKELLGHYQLVDAVLHCAAKERKFGAPADEKSKAQRKTAGENLEKIAVDCRKRFSSFRASTPDQYRQLSLIHISAHLGQQLFDRVGSAGAPPILPSFFGKDGKDALFDIGDCGGSPY